jgi:hypothetical protein
MTMFLRSSLYYKNLPKDELLSLDYNGNVDTDIDVDVTPVSIFYNIYIPPNDPEEEGEITKKMSYVEIIEEQVSQIGLQSAFAVSHDLINNNALTLHFVTIGEEPFATELMDSICNRHYVNCVHERHFKEGFEMLTEQLLLDYCNEEENLYHTVSYIHSKGTFHTSDAQNNIRREMTKQALSKECIDLLDAGQCNVCGPNFLSVWGPTYWGNMWSAKCEYVKDLVSPFELETKNDLAVSTRPKEMQMRLYESKMEKFTLGQDRYAAEQFVGTHPNLVPCSYKDGLIWSVDPPGTFESHVLRTGLIVEDGDSLEEMMKRIEMEVDNNHLREWYLLPGILWRYHVLYDEMPPSDSWIWRHYPDGANWRQVVAKKGYPGAFYHRMKEVNKKEQKLHN